MFVSPRIIALSLQHVTATAHDALHEDKPGHADSNQDPSVHVASDQPNLFGGAASDGLAESGSSGVRTASTHVHGAQHGEGKSSEAGQSLGNERFEFTGLQDEAGFTRGEPHGAGHLAIESRQVPAATSDRRTLFGMGAPAGLSGQSHPHKEWIRRANRYCPTVVGSPHAHRTFQKLSDAEQVCKSMPTSCFGVYDHACDGRGDLEADFRMCMSRARQWKSSSAGSCVYVHHGVAAPTWSTSAPAATLTKTPTEHPTRPPTTQFPTLNPTDKPTTAPTRRPTVKPKFVLGYNRSNDCPDGYISVQQKDECRNAMTYMHAGRAPGAFGDADATCASSCPSGCFQLNGTAYFNPKPANAFSPRYIGQPICVAPPTSTPTAAPTRTPSTHTTTKPTTQGETWQPTTRSPTKKWAVRDQMFCPERFAHRYRTMAEADRACQSNPSCSGVYDRNCENFHDIESDFALCLAGPVFHSHNNSCVYEKEHSNTFFGYVKTTHCVDDDGHQFQTWSPTAGKGTSQKQDITKCKRLCDVQHSCQGIRFDASKGEAACQILVHKAARLTRSGPFKEWKVSSKPTPATACLKRKSTALMPETGLEMFTFTPRRRNRLVCTQTPSTSNARTINARNPVFCKASPRFLCFFCT